MKKFAYKVKDQKGKTLKGIVEAGDAKTAARLLRLRGFFVVSLKFKKESLFSKFDLFRRVRLDDLVNFTRQLSTMITSGLSITESLSILEVQARPVMAQVIGNVLSEVESGHPLAQAMEDHPQVFDHVYISLVKAGEVSGTLDNILNQLAENLEEKRGFQNKIKGALIYPAIITVGMVLVGMVMMIFVLPRMMAFYEDFQADLPLITRMLIAVSNFVAAYWWVAAFFLAVLSISFRFLRGTPVFRERIDELYFKIPIFGKIRKMTMLTEFTRTMGLLIGSGILVVDALEIIKSSFGSPIYQKALELATEQVKKGFPLTFALAQAEIFPHILVQMVSVGEETGKLDDNLSKVSAYFEQEADVLVKGLTSSLEPVIMIILGIGVAFLVAAIILPIYSLTSEL